MEIDSTTLQDLSIFHPDESQSVLSKLNFCRSDAGSNRLKQILTHPKKNLTEIKETETAVQTLLPLLIEWPESISNGTLQMIEKFYAYPFGVIPKGSWISCQLYPVFNYQEFAMIRFSMNHLVDFLKGMHQLRNLLERNKNSTVLDQLKEQLTQLLQPWFIQEIIARDKTILLRPKMLLKYGAYLYVSFQNSCNQLLEIFTRLDVWYSMARAHQTYRLTFPDWIDADQPMLKAKGLRHLLLQNPVCYDLDMDHGNNFIFLSGANMAGKSTFIKSVGCAVYLAHLGIGVPAENMRLSLFHGILTNIQAQDNLSKGESFFLNEVHRIKSTLEKISDNRIWLVLIDELFKGTNIQDAMLCSKIVIEGLIHVRKTLFILSTHLFELGEELTIYPNMIFKHFETRSTLDSFSFTYQLKEGISRDRFGYLILKKEKITDLLDSFKQKGL